MSGLSAYYERRLKPKLAHWLMEEGVGYVMGIALFSVWLHAQPAEVQVVAPEMLRRAFEFIADKWL